MILKQKTSAYSVPCDEVGFSVQNLLEKVVAFIVD
jgi:hypothetical protein